MGLNEEAIEIQLYDSVASIYTAVLILDETEVYLSNNRDNDTGNISDFCLTAEK